MNTPTNTPPGKPGSPLGLHRVLAPEGVLPQAALRLDPDPRLRDDEVRIDVEYLNLDAASYRQLHEEHGGDGDAIREAVRAIVRERGKMHNPVTGSGGMLIGTVAEAGPETPLGLKAGERVATLVSLTLTPLELTDGLRDWDGLGERVPARGHAILFGRSVAAVLPADLPDELSLAVLDVCGAPALTGRTVAEYAARTGRAPSVAVLGAAGKSGSLALAAARRAGAGRLVGVVPNEVEAIALTASGLAGSVLRADARDAVALADGLAAHGGPADITVVCTDVPGCEHAAVLATEDGGTVVFFSMATSFPAAALGAEGLRADVTMLIGNGYQPGHAEQALHLVRTEPGVRALFDRRIGRTARQEDSAVAAPAPAIDRIAPAVANDASAVVVDPGHTPRATTAPAGKLGLDPRLVRRARELAARAGAPSWTWPGPTPRSPWNGPPCDWPGCPAPTPRASPGPTDWSTPSATRSAWNTAWPCPCGTPCAPAPAATSPNWPRAPRPATCPSGCPRVPPRAVRSPTPGAPWRAASP